METNLITLKNEIKQLRQERDDLELALQTAIDHGDAIEEQLVATNEKLTAEIHERILAESRLEQLLNHLKQQKDDLELLVKTVTEHSDQMDTQWLERYSQMEKLSMLDGLTRIANRRAFDAALKKEWKRCQRSAQPLGLLLCDVDHFKQFNDFYGHQKGDECLVWVAVAVAKSCQRPSDLAARYGGEEFVILLPQTNAAGVQEVAESLRLRLRDLALPHARSPHGLVTISQGGSVIVPRADILPTELLMIADQQLYIAKSSGRDTFSITSLPV
ncbi:MAG: diguanylate cyclase [Magnetococcus sp. DMHC-1]|nr:diguanylate cyclase [Magnetococcales bacterium]